MVSLKNESHKTDRTIYDFLSIMHYWNAAYSVNGKLIVVPRPGYEAIGALMGFATSLSAGDKALIQKIYGVI